MKSGWPLFGSLGAGNVRGMALMFVATICFSSMHAMIRHLSGELHPFELAFFRNLFGLFVVAPWFIRYGWAPLRTQRLPLHMFRAALNVVAMLSFFYALSLVPLSEAAALSFAAPVFATVLAIFILGERIGIRRWAAIIFGFGGTFVIIRPGFETVNFGSLLMLLSAAVWSCTLMVIKILGRTESSVTIATYTLIQMVPLSLIPAWFVWQWPSWEMLGYMLIMGLVGTIGQLLMTQALKEGETNAVLPLDFFKLIWAMLIGYFLFAEIPDAFTWIGGIMIFASATYIAYRENKLRKETARPQAGVT